VTQRDIAKELKVTQPAVTNALALDRLILIFNTTM
jgi:predicted transcriptional regulator